MVDLSISSTIDNESFEASNNCQQVRLASLAPVPRENSVVYKHLLPTSGGSDKPHKWHVPAIRHK